MNNHDLLQDAFEWVENTPPEFYAQIMLTTVRRAPLLATARLARLVIAGIEGCRACVPGQLWAYVVLPESVRVIVGLATTPAIEQFAERLKHATAMPLLDAIRRAAKDSAGRSLGETLKACLNRHEELYWDVVERHIARHLAPFAKSS